MTGVLQNPKKAIPFLFLIFGLILVVLSTCKVPPGSEPPPGGIRITTSGQPQSFFNGLTCRYAICQSGGDPKNPDKWIAEGTFSLNSGTGSEVANLISGEYDLYIAIDVDSDGYTFSPVHPFDGDLHDVKTNITVDETVIDRYFTLKTVAGVVSWTPSLSGDLYVDLCTHVPPPPSPGFAVAQQVNYFGITNASSATYALDATDLGGGPYYLLGILTPPAGNLLNALRGSWYDGADGAAGTDTPPIDLSNLQNSYDFFLSQ